MAKKRKGGGIGPQFITLHHWLLKSPAFFDLSGDAVKLMVCLTRRFNGHNNPGISMSNREAMREVGCSKNHASKLFRELEEKGFLERHSRGAFSLKNRHASTWRLLWCTERSGSDEIKEAAKTFMRYAPRTTAQAHKNQSTLPRRGTDGPTP